MMLEKSSKKDVYEFVYFVLFSYGVYTHPRKLNSQYVGIHIKLSSTSWQTITNRSFQFLLVIVKMRLKTTSKPHSMLPYGMVSIKCPAFSSNCHYHFD